MGPPRRNPPEKDPKTKPSHALNVQKSTEQLVPDSSTSQSPPSLGMTPETRYQHNLKVVRRRDPTITSIFDQFGHICVYQCINGKWDKIGCEGSMFIFESSTYPPYGFYVLNRTGNQDFIQRLYPEDTLSAVGRLLGIRHFHKFTANRLASIKASLGNKPMPGPFDEAYVVPDVENLTLEDKGEQQLMGLWWHTDTNREPMIDVVKRLHEYVKQNVPYPQQFRYGPGHPPPPHRLKAVSKPSTLSRNVAPSDASDSDTNSVASSKPAESEVERLFAKLIPTPTHSAPPEPSHHQKAPPVTVESLFAHLSGSEVAHSAPVTPAPASTGIKLLDTIFASASAGVSSPPVHVPRSSEHIEIFSPTPSTSTIPQVLNQDVISTLLGLPPSRSASAASTTHSAGARSHTSRDGDNEEDSDASISPTHSGNVSTRWDAQPEAVIGGSGFLGVPEQSRNKQGRINGDVTPRAFANGSGSQFKNQNPVPSVLEAASSVSTVRAFHSPNPSTSTTSTVAPASNGKPRANRPLVPFESDSELWPYSSSMDSINDHGDGDDHDIVELDFQETSVLSDPDAFSKALRNKDRKDDNGLGQLNGGSREKVRGKKKGRKERDARDRADIEKSWDVPQYCASYASQAAERRQQLASPPASPSPPPSPPPVPVRAQTPSSKRGPFIEAATPKMAAKPSPIANGRGTAAILDSPRGKGKKAEANGASAKVDKFDKEAAKNSIIASLEARPRPIDKVERNEFIREILTLIHTDKGFVDTLYQQYMSRLA